ncbi:MAG: hypothetical protein HFACDABA_02330 [Anaerolineales bacterium]|nr:hypothetical protein [Anaerolineales bacterium]
MQIIFNGKSYNSLEEMPASERDAYQSMLQIFKDANGNGIPDFLEGDIVKNVATAFTSNLVYNGKTYANMDELPAEARQKLSEAMGKLNQLGIVTNRVSATEKPAFEPAFKPSRPLITPEPAIQEGGGRNWILIVGFIGAVLVCAVAAAAFAFLR